VYCSLIATDVQSVQFVFVSEYLAHKQKIVFCYSIQKFCSATFSGFFKVKRSTSFDLNNLPNFADKIILSVNSCAHSAHTQNA